MFFRMQLQIIALFIFFIPHAFAGACDQTVTIGNSISDNWNDQCKSVHYLRYDPYSPQRGYPAKFFKFELERDADIRISMTPGYNTQLFLIKGDDKTAAPLLSYQNDKIETRLTSGTYVVEAVNRYATNATFKIEYNDIGLTQCVTPLTLGNTINDGWVSDCESSNRDIDDPYDTIPGEGHRAKYYSFTLMQDADISINVNSSVDSYVYILEGLGEHGTPYTETAQKKSNHFLTAGDYTIELTTKDRYAPGQFSLHVASYINENGCEQTLILGSTISGTWSSDCAIRSWIDDNGDPYQGSNSPERANYYTFSLSEASDIKFTRTANNHDDTVMSIYAADDYFNKIKSTKNQYYWRSPSAEMTTSLPAGHYVLELTQHQKIASGPYEFHTELLTTNGCNNLISLGDNKSGIISSTCTSNNRGSDGNNDPYGTQQGTYYAKRFEFTLADETSVRISANSSNSSYLYLSKKTNNTTSELTQSWPTNHWNTTSYPSIDRRLDAGTYVIELTSHYPENELTFNLSIDLATSPECNTFIRLNERRASEYINSSCLSIAKKPIYNYDPYSSNGTKYFHSKSYSFEIMNEGNYEIATNSNALHTHIFLFDGGDSHYLNLDDKSSYSSNNTLTYYLEPGIYSVEITTAAPQKSGAFSLLIWDKTSTISEYQISDSVCNKSLNTTIPVQSSLDPYCTSDDRGSSYQAKYFTFSVDQESLLTSSINASFITYMGLYKYSTDTWQLMLDDDSYTTTKSIRANLTAGQYRIEVGGRSPNNSGSFRLTSHLDIDSDGDGYSDASDAFPDDPTEWLDTDNDGLGNNIDMDDDNDQVADIEDDFPLDKDETKDSDNDNIGDNSDSNPFSFGGDIRFSENNYSVKENAGTAEFLITRTHSLINLTVYYFTRDLTANAEKDYKPTFGKVDFINTEREKTISIPIIDNDNTTGDRDFEVYLLTFNAYETSFSQGNSSTITIIDNEIPNSTISLTNSDIALDETAGTAEVTVTRTGDLSRSDTVYFRTADGSASALEDYIPLSGGLSFEPNESEISISIQVIEDNFIEPRESFYFQLLKADNATLKNTQTRIDIKSDATEDSTIYSLGIKHVNVTANNQDFPITIYRNKTDSSSTIGFSIKGISEEYDYFSWVSFKAGEKGKTVTIPLIKSSNKLWNERTIEVSLTGASDGHIASSEKMLINLRESTKLPYNGLLIPSSNTYTVKEGESTNISIGYLSANDFNKELNIKSLPSTASAGQDYTSINATMALTSNTPSAFTTLKTIEDDFNEGSESLNILIDNYRLPISKVIIDDSNDYQGTGTVSFSSNRFMAEKNKNLAFVLQRLYGAKGSLPITLKTRDGNAIAEQHYRALSKQLVFSDGETSLNSFVEILNFAGDESLHFYIDVEFNLDSGKTVSETVRIDITPVTTSAVSAENAKKKKSDDDGFLGLGFINAWLMLLLALPLLISRVKIDKQF